MWSTNIKAMITQNQTRFLKCQRILIANMTIPKTMHAANAISALLRKVMRKNTGAKMPPILRPV